MDGSAWCKLVVGTQTPLGGFQCILFAASFACILAAIQNYHAGDRFNFNCDPKPSDFTRQICYNKYISTLGKPGLIPRNVVTITFSVLCACWIGFAIYGAVTLQKIIRNQHDQRVEEKAKKAFRRGYFIQVLFRIFFLGGMLGLFCNYQTIYLPSSFKCDVPQTSPTVQTELGPFNQTKITLQCNDLYYKEKSHLNLAVVVIHALFMVFGILEVIHLWFIRKTILQYLLGNIDTFELENLMSGVPEKPKIANTQFVVDVPFILNWSAPPNGIKYRLEWTKISTAGSIEPRVLQEDIVGTHFNIADLDYNSEYEVKLFAVNVHGESEPDIRTFKTKIGVPEKPKITNTQYEVDVPFILNWSAPQNGIKYRLEWAKICTAGAIEPRVLQKDVIETHFNIADLDYNSEYEVKLFAVNVHGESEPDIRTFKTKIGNFDPNEIINGIRQLYKTCEGWLSPFPWCEEFQFFLGNIFTRLKVVRRKKTRGEVTDMFVDMSSILDPYEECEAPRTVLIEGEPGTGKTTYCKKFVYDWATGMQETMGCGVTAFKAVLLLKCRDVHSDVWGAIEDQLLPRDIDEEVKQQFFRFIYENQISILLILDGLDELPSYELPMFSELIKGRVLPRCHIVATARQEVGKGVRKYCDTLLEIKGFTKEHVDNFVIKYFKDRLGLATKLLERMRCDENLREMAANPLNTTLLCLLCEEFDGTLPENRAQLYLDMVECVLRIYRKKKGYSKTKAAVTNLYKPQLNRLGLVALNGLLNDKLDFGESELGNHAKDLTAFGFLSVQPGSGKLRQKLHYAFLHKSFQEWFAAFFICSQIRCKEITPESLVSDERYFGKLKQVLLFLCGILSMQCDEQIVTLVNSLTNHVNKHEGNGTEVVLMAINECKREHDFPLRLAKCFGSGLNLTTLNLFEDSIGHAGATSIAEAIKVNKTLTNLDVSWNQISAAGATSIAKAVNVNKTLSNMNLRGNDIRDAGATSVAEAIEVNKILTKLDLSRNHITFAGATSIAKAIKVNEALTVLHLFDNRISDGGATSIAEAIKVNKTLTNLNLSYNQICDTGATSLAEAIKVNVTLTDLNLSYNQICDIGAASIAEAIKVNKTLNNLDLSGNRITDASATYIAEAIKVTKTLTNLDLSGNRVTYAGVTPIAEASKVNKTLTNLNLYGNDIADAGVTSIPDQVEIVYESDY